MTPEPDYSSTAARLLKRSTVEEIPDSPEARRAAVAAMELALRTGRSPLQSRWVWLAAAAGVIALVAGALALQSPRTVRTTAIATAASRGTLTAPGQPPQGVVAGAVLPEASRLTTPPQGNAELQFSTGTRVTLAGASDVTLEAIDTRQRLFLANGRLDATVAHVASGSSFVVATRDSEVEVHGTAFSVEVVPAEAGCGQGATTRVSVTEGIVAVRFAGQEVRLRAGERWPVCAQAAVSPESPAARADVEQASSLAAQNDLFAQAVTLKRQGDAAGAVALYEHLLEAWPQGPLAESATVERMKLLAGHSPADGARAARAYLEKYPHGFARDEAKALLDRR